MLVLQWVVLSLYFQRGLTKKGVDPESVGDDVWIFCHGMPMDVFHKACACMLKFKSFVAEKYGIDTKAVDHWPISGDRIYSRDDCIDEMDKVFADKKKRRRKRKFYNMFKHLWTPPIPYSYHPDVTPQDKIMIRAGMQHWMNNTCLVYQHEPDFDVENKTAQRIIYTAANDGCYSYVGKQNPSTVFPQQINLKPAACTAWLGVVVHEIGHSLGFFHEQNRMDREAWVVFYAENTNPNAIQNFDLESNAEDLGVPYDYGSVMQYDNKAFSSNGKIVLETTLPYSEFSLGQRGHLSFLDTKIANIAYCGAVCASAPALPCKHGGYIDPKDCTKCRCPEGLGGRLCETAAPSSPGCLPQQSVLEATDEVQCVSSPGYDTGNYYPLGTQCSWLIQAPPGQLIRGQFQGGFGVYCMGGKQRGPVCFHWVEIKYKMDKEIRGARICCQKVGMVGWNDPGIIVSEDNTVVIHFDGSYPVATNAYTSIPKTYQRQGFQFCFALNTATMEPALNDIAKTTTQQPWWMEEEPTTTPDIELKILREGESRAQAVTCSYFLPLAGILATILTL